MRKPHLIEPFPTDIDRNHFASWLSGFTDGEGCFLLLSAKRGNDNRFQAIAQFLLSLRRDDSRVLKLIQSYFQCGFIYEDPRSYTDKSIFPKASFRVNRIEDHKKIIIPHFLKHPLFAKKRRDFEIWKEGVLFMSVIKDRPQRHRGSGRNGSFGRLPNWTSCEKEHFSLLTSKMKEQRKYDSSVIYLPDSPPESFGSTPLF